MATRETRLQRGRRRGEALVDGTVTNLRDQRVTLGISQRALCRELGWSQSEYSRFERRVQIRSVGVVDISEVAALLGLELAASLHPVAALCATRAIRR